MEEIFKKNQDIYDIHVPAVKSEESLQRTPEWFKQREGKFTGSEIYKLMGVDRSFSKHEWGSPEKMVSFNETAKKYVFSKAMERKRNKVIRTHLGKAANYGVEQESVIVEMLIEKGHKIKEVGFIEFIEGIAGASPDGLVNSNMALEIKASTNWDTLYSRHMILFDQSHGDFWQIQAEMLALKVKKCMYVVAEASEDMYEPNITDLSVQYVDSSPIHQEALIQRCMIGNDAIVRYLKGVEFHEAVRQACTEYETPGSQEIPKTPTQETKLTLKPKIDVPF